MALFLFRIVVLLLVHAGLCSSKDTLTVSTPLTDGDGDTLVSAGKRFVLGFFTPNGSHNGDRYVGIWYYGSSPKTVVWVANHETPLNDRSGLLAIREGDPSVLDGHNKSYWSTELRVLSASYLKLLDSGNLVLLLEDGSTLWQSFHNPTDTFLPGMKMDGNFKLTSWTSETDPRMGSFTFERSQDGQYIIWNGSVPYWKSGPLEDFISSDARFQEVSGLLSNFSADTTPSTSKYNRNLRHHNVSYGNINRSIADYNNTRLVMNVNGEIRFFKGKSWEDPWTVNWRQPRDNCSVFRYCGSFASCNSGNRIHCKCLPGFEPNSPDNWIAGYFSDGCKRRSPLCSKDVHTSHFIKLKMMRVLNEDKYLYSSKDYPYSNETKCREACLDNCNCQAYSFKAEIDSGVTCLIWLDSLYDIQEQYDGRDGRDLNVRVPPSDIELTKRDCETCGTYIIGYPLSTGPKCGDPMYSSFKCDNATGQVTFEVSNNSYPVTSINYERHEFSIQVPDCSANHSVKEILQHNQSLPFDVTNGCQISSEDEWSNEVEISWNGPSEPLCSASEGCNDWPNSSCDIAGNGKRKCLCKKPFKWDPAQINCTSEEPLSNANENFAKKHYPILLAVTASFIIVASAAFYLCHLQRKGAVTRRENRESIQGNIAFRLEDSERQVKDFVDSGQFEENDRKGIDVPYFDLECILAATDNFSDENKLGQGGFGPVYKGKLSGGQEIAIKRLSSGSAQGLTEFKNEVVLIAKLQHRNLVRLLGYCVAGYEKMLVYEYMPNRSLDSFIFDRTLCHLLNWERRFDIIMGIARGLLYLHQDSRLRIIHRDLKASNVLLDDEMNPKISDFGLARIVGGKQTEAQTERVVGTYGYMSPEYALDGLFSTKSDVFSFGVVVLEILSGKRNTGFYNVERGLSLLVYAWRLWKEEKILNLMDQALCETCNTNEFLRCVNVGLLCVQEDPCDRPTMSNVVFMLGSETATLPSPKEPAFIERRSRSVTGSSSSKLDSNNELTISLEKGR